MNLENLRERPILFNEFSTKANLAGRKSETRRANGFDPTPKKPDGINVNPDEWYLLDFDANTNEALFIDKEDAEKTTKVKCPWKRGDLLWGRETVCPRHPDHMPFEEDPAYFYRANCIEESEEIRKQYIEAGYDYRWRPSIQMPKAAARQFAICTNVFPQRLNDITEEQAIAEGVEVAPAMDELPEFAWNNYNKYRVQNHDSRCLSAIDSYRSLLERMNSPEWVKKNPWLWVVQYDLISTTGRPSDELITETLNKHKITL